MAGGTAHADVYAARLGDSSLGLFLILIFLPFTAATV